MEPAEITNEVATPFAPVTAVDVLPVGLLGNTGRAPTTGAVKRTVTPGTGLPFASLTSAVSGLGNSVPMTADSAVKLLLVIVAGVPAVFVSEKVTFSEPMA